MPARVDYIDIYRASRLDPAIAIDEAIGALTDLAQAGYVRHIEPSEVVSRFEEGKGASICDLQIKHSAITRDIEREIRPVCRKLGIAITAWPSPLTPPSRSQGHHVLPL